MLLSRPSPVRWSASSGRLRGRFSCGPQRWLLSPRVKHGGEPARFAFSGATYSSWSVPETEFHLGNPGRTFLAGFRLLMTDLQCTLIVSGRPRRKTVLRYPTRV